MTLSTKQLQQHFQSEQIKQQAMNDMMEAGEAQYKNIRDLYKSYPDSIVFLLKVFEELDLVIAAYDCSDQQPEDKYRIIPNNNSIIMYLEKTDTTVMKLFDRYLDVKWVRPQNYDEQTNNSSYDTVIGLKYITSIINHIVGGRKQTVVEIWVAYCLYMETKYGK